MKGAATSPLFGKYSCTRFPFFPQTFQCLASS
jgi:hypothetical protein